MKHFLLLLIAFAVIVQLKAQDNESHVIVASSFGVTIPLSEMPDDDPMDIARYKRDRDSEDEKEHRPPQKYLFHAEDGPAYRNDEESMQKNMGTVPSHPTKISIPGQTSVGGRPFDPSGAVGPTHYVQMINSTFLRIYNKTTGAILQTKNLGSLWNPATPDVGDPIVMYDKAADRWFLAQFDAEPSNKMYIAISTTNNPTGSYYTYTFVSPDYPDYLKFSVWRDGYYMTANFGGQQKVFCFERAAMLAGTPGARAVYKNFNPVNPGGFVCPLSGDAADGVLPPAGSPCPVFYYTDNGWGTGATDGVAVYNMAVNWTPTTPTATLTLANNIALAAFDASYDANSLDCSQPGTTQKLDGIGGALMYRAQWKTWTGYNTIVLNWGVKISATQRGIKWCELRQNQTSGIWSLYQEGIYAPDANTRWMGAIAMDNNGSIGLSYVKSNATNIYPGLYYTGRRTCDPLGKLPLTEVTVAAGTGSQIGVNRIGDYAQTTLDPNGLTFWSTSEYMGGPTGPDAAITRIFSYEITPCATATTASVTIAMTSGTNPSCAGVSRTFTATAVNGGTAPTYQWKIGTTNVGTNSPTFTTTALTNGQSVTCVMTSNLAGVTGSPATSNAISNTISATVAPTIAIALTTGKNPSCAGASKTFTATPTNGGTTPSYQWKISGVNAGTNANTFTTTALTAGQIVTCVMTSNLACASPTTATSTGITASFSTAVAPAVSIALTAGSNPSASGASVTFTATPTNGGAAPTYQWKVSGVNAGTGGNTFTTTTLTTGKIITCVMTSNAACTTTPTATSNAINMTITGAITYCAASTTNATATDEYISKVTMGTINKTSANSSYSNFSSLSTNVAVGTGYPITITLTNSYTTDKVLIWVDWNNNGVLTDAGEAVYASPQGIGPFTTTITPPTGAGITLGMKRMRIRLTDASSSPANLTPCGVSEYGEVEDYALNVTSVSPYPKDPNNEEANEPQVYPLKAELLGIYPNPSNGTVNIKAENEGEYFIVNTEGKLIQSIKLNAENNYQTEVRDLAAGVYVIAGQNKFGITKQKIVVIK